MDKVVPLNYEIIQIGLRFPSAFVCGSINRSIQTFTGDRCPSHEGC